ncbi:ribosomal protein L7/L12 [Planctomycetaceae bacterium]|nr:ribosomal protein L7/L12 [Planctomycetaceae bacterium]
MDPILILGIVVLLSLVIGGANKYTRRNAAKISQLESTVEVLKENAGIDFDPNEALRTQIVEELASGNKIQAIKLHRDTMGSGLKEAKDFVEEIERTLADDA